MTSHGLDHADARWLLRQLAEHAREAGASLEVAKLLEAIAGQDDDEGLVRDVLFLSGVSDSFRGAMQRTVAEPSRWN